MIFSYYGFLEADTLSHIAPGDFKFLEHKGCFHIPSPPILDDFVREYFLHVHSGLPILNERNSWELYLGEPQGHKEPQKLYLFLFRAMLFASCSVRFPNSHLSGHANFNLVRLHGHDQTDGIPRCNGRPDLFLSPC
jgi:hypothetical protein